MNQLKELFNRIRAYFINENVPQEYKSVYIICLYNVPGALAFMIMFAATHSPLPIVCVAAGMFLFFICMIYVLYRFEDLDFVKYFLLFVMNYLIYPTFFYLTGDIYNGGALYFALGFIALFFIISNKAVYVFAILQLIWDCIILYMPMAFPAMFDEYRKDMVIGVGITISFAAAAFVPMFVIAFQTLMYNRTHAQLKDSGRIIEEAKLNKTRFLANITNEIRTPMNAIIGMNELIIREDLDSESRELAENIKTSSANLLKIINNVLEFSKLDTNRMELMPQSYDLRKMITEIINSVSIEYATDGNEFLVKIDPDIPSILFGDVVRIRQIFLYILFSTINKIPHNRISLTINGDVDRATNTVLISAVIAESGLGLSDKEIEAMLSAYSRYDSRQKSDYRGMGLEVLICKEILEKMGGTLEIESVEGVGMAFKMELINYIIEDIPLVKLSPVTDYSILVYCQDDIEQDLWINMLSDFQIFPTIVNGPNAFRKSIENRRYTHIFINDVFYSILEDTIKETQISENVFIVTEADSVYSDFGECKIVRKPLTCLNIIPILNNEWKADAYKLANKKEKVIFPNAKILIVDDSVVNLKVLAGMLSSFKINAKTCKSGMDALKILEKEDFDMLILDQRMPEMDGIELLHHIRQMNNLNSLVPILCATADFGAEVAKKLSEEGFQDYLAKPVRRYYLERVLRKYMPSELAINVKDDEEDVDIDSIESKKKKIDKKNKEDTKSSIEENDVDPLDIDFERGLAFVGGSVDAFNAVIQSYYKEGIKKLTTVENMIENDLPTYVIEVHALKSSSAAIGANGISNMFKSLEFAGRASDRDYIDSHSSNTFEQFKKVLDVVKDYLAKHDLIEEEDNKEETIGDLIILNSEDVQGIIDALATYNLKLCEDKLKELVKGNYGSEFNDKIKEISDLYEMFDYHKVKDKLIELRDSINN